MNVKEDERYNEKIYAYWLCSLPGIGGRTIAKLLEACGGSAKKVYQSPEKVWEKVLRSRQLENMKRLTAKWKPEEEYAKLGAGGIAFYIQEDKDYPERLRQISDPPYGIFCKGKMPDANRLSVAIIGSRDCSQYGRHVAFELGRYLGERGVQIISGMARGIDGISQEAALEAGGASYGVLGCGVDICYPSQNRKLYDSLIVKGGVLSAYPPGTLAKSGHFPPRNRIVSGLADVVVVIEARNKSGTLITVDMALEQGKEVYVVPGRITDRLSDGCNGLLRQGAGIVLSPRDFFEEIKGMWEEKHGFSLPGEMVCTGEKKEAEKNEERSCPSELQKIYDALDFYPQSLEKIVQKVDDSYHPIEVNTLLLRLCIENLAVQLSPGYFCRKVEKNSILL